MMQRLVVGARVAMRNPLGAALALALAFGVWEILFADFMADDLMQLAVLEGVSPAAVWTSPLDLYTIADGNPVHVQAMQDAGLFPWFAEPSFEMRFLRPLSSLMLVLDHRLFGLHPSGYRLDGVLWSLLLVTTVSLILRRALPGRSGAMATVVFALSAIHGIFCWSAARHVVVAAALGFAGLSAHMRWREEGWTPGAALSLLALSLSLLASEVGMAVAVYLLAYEGVGRSDAFTARARAATPALILLVAYVVLWGSFGHGASAGSDYIDPLRNTGEFLREMPGRLAVLSSGVVLGGGGVDLWVLRPAWRPLMKGVGALVCIAFAILLRVRWPEIPTAERRALSWLGAGAVGSAIPFTGTPIGGRCLIVPFVGGAAILAVLIVGWWSEWRQRRGSRYRILGAACAGLAVMHLAIAPLGRLGAPLLLRRTMVDHVAAALSQAELDVDKLASQSVFVLVAPDFLVGLHSGFYRLLHRLPRPAAWRVLSWASAPHRFIRTRPDTLEMEIAEDGIARRALRAGSVVTLQGMKATVLDAAAGAPYRVRFEFARSLDDPSMVLLLWQDGRLRRVAAPDIGQSIAYGQVLP